MMKGKFWVTPVILAAFATVAFTGCDSPTGNDNQPGNGGGQGGGGATPATFTVTFDSHGGSAVADQRVARGGTATRPQDPTRGGHTFTNWFGARTGGTAFDFATPITGDTTIHARWQTVAVNGGDGTGTGNDGTGTGNDGTGTGDNGTGENGGGDTGTGENGTGNQPGEPAAPTIIMVSSGSAHTVAIKSDGTLWAWGNNANGRTGLGLTSENTIEPTQVGTDSDWYYVSAASQHTMAIRTDGTLWAWGNNDNARTGLNTITGNTAVPTQVGTASNWRTVSAGNNFGLAVTTDNQLFAWGSNADNRTGRNTTAGSTGVPTRLVGTADNWRTVSAGNAHGLAITTEGQLFAWGSNADARTGFNATTGNTATPTRVGTASNWESVSGGSNFSLAVTTTGQLWSWGSNGLNRTGHPSTTLNTAVPTRVGTATHWASVSAGSSHSLAVTTGGQLWSWGNNEHSRTGFLETVESTAAPTRVGQDSDWESVSAGDSHSMGISAGALFGMGNNANGRLGDGTTTRRNTPTLVNF